MQYQTDEGEARLAPDPAARHDWQGRGM